MSTLPLRVDGAGKSFGTLFGKMRGSYESEPESGEADSSPVNGRFAEQSEAELEDNPAVTSTRQELSGLMDKVRLLSRQFKS